MRIFFDTEFIEDGSTIDLVSIGMIREDGSKAFYRESSEVDLSKADQWVKEKVLPNLLNMPVPLKSIAKDIIEFVGEAPEFWAYYADYDWVVLCQLYGRMIDLPEGWPMYCRDIKQLCDELGNPKLAPGDDKHNALTDAVWTKEQYKFLRGLQATNI